MLLGSICFGFSAYTPFCTLIIMPLFTMFASMFPSETYRFGGGSLRTGRIAFSCLHSPNTVRQSITRCCVSLSVRAIIVLFINFFFETQQTAYSV